MSLEYLKWNITKESGRPLYKDQMIWDKDKQEAVLKEQQQNKVKCLCKLNSEEEPIILTYCLDKDKWFYDYEQTYFIDYEEVEKWYPLSDITDYLDGKPEPMNCWEFGWYTAKRSIPALETWIENGVSYKYGMTPEKWKAILTKIKQGFEVSLSDLDGDLDNITDLEERKRILEEHDAIRKDAFALMAEYYLDLWD